ncbi:stage III sporulation protein AB [Domibacillus robiginosus]|uniref:stage III sporulation protein AB n=1 Tax=Domibacillus robiginosus TaxID=1071054 RepID=UPI00067E222E|nr:stage III sporulation protein AB [Domibacillus robiginosus]
MKWAGALFIVAASLFIGWHKSRSYGERVRQIRQFETALMMLESSIAYGAESMETAVRAISNTIEKPADRIFAVFAEELSNSEKSAEDLWSDVLKKHSSGLALKKRDLQIVEQAGCMLGTVTQTAEARKLQLVLKQLEKQREEAATEEKKLSGMTRSVSLLFGLMTAILLL